MSIEKAEQTRIINNYHITVAKIDLQWSQLDEIDKELAKILDKIQEALE